MAALGWHQLSPCLGLNPARPLKCKGWPWMLGSIIGMEEATALSWPSRVVPSRRLGPGLMPLRVVEHDGSGTGGGTDNAAGAGYVPTGLPGHVCHIHTSAPEIRHNET